MNVPQIQIEIHPYHFVCFCEIGMPQGRSNQYTFYFLATFGDKLSLLKLSRDPVNGFELTVMKTKVD